MHKLLSLTLSGLGGAGSGSTILCESIVNLKSAGRIAGIR